MLLIYLPVMLLNLFYVLCPNILGHILPVTAPTFVNTCEKRVTEEFKFQLEIWEFCERIDDHPLNCDRIQAIAISPL